MAKKLSWVTLYIALGIVWGCSFIFIKLGLEFLTPIGVAFGRVCLGALTLLLWARYKEIALPKGKIMWLHLWVVSMLLNVIPGILFAYAETEVTSILAGIINAVTPLMTLLAIMIAFREEKPKNYQVVGLLTGFIGVLTVLGAWQGLGDNPAIAVIALLSAVACYGVSYPYSRKFVLPKKLKAESLAAGQLTMGAVTLLPLFIIDGASISGYSTGPILAMLTLGILGSGFAYIWNFQIMEAAGLILETFFTSCSVTSKSEITPLTKGRVAVLYEGVLPTIFLASSPIAKICPVLLFTATTDGSFIIIPLSFIKS
jgi:drug/metabolite transporter (DMT)-like permease